MKPIKLTESQLISLIKEELKARLNETPDEYSKPETTEFLKLVKRYDPENVNRYKNIIFKKTLKDAKLELAKKLNVSYDRVEKATASGKGTTKSGNPLGKGGRKPSSNSGEDEITPTLLTLEDYDIEAILSNASDKDKSTVSKYFTWEVFDMINQAASRLAERHNAQIENVKGGGVDFVDPYTNKPIIDTDEAVLKRGAYYQNETNYNKSRQLHNPKAKTDNAIEKNTISGLRWIYSNAKNCG